MLKSSSKPPVRRTGDSQEIAGDYQYKALNSGPPIQRTWHRLKLELLDHIWTPTDGMHVLDVGCGSGVVSRAIADRGALVDAVDGNPEAIDFIKNQQPHPKVTCHMGLVDELSFEPASFDAVVCLEVMEHIYLDQVQVLMRSIHSLLKPGGTALLTTPNYRGLWPIVEWASDRMGPGERMHGLQHVTRFHRASFQRELISAGFEIEVLRTYCTFAPFAAAASERLSRYLAGWERKIDLPFGNLLVALVRKPK